MSLLVGFVDRQFIHNNPPNPCVSFKGKTAIVTGSNVGLGQEAVRKLVQLGASLVILAVRSVNKGELAVEDIQASAPSMAPDTLQVWPLDMSSYASVIAFGERVKTLPRLDILIANAGIATTKFKLTEDNEETITTNVVSTSLLATLVFPKLRATALKFDTHTHLTLTASELYEVAKFEESKVPAGKIFATLNNEATAKMGDRYNVSKLMGIFVVKQLAALSSIDSDRVVVNCVAPGFCYSQLHRDNESTAYRIAQKVLCRPTEVGARTLVWGACAGPTSHGQYVPDCKIKPTAGLTQGQEGAALQRRVWEELKEKLEAIRPGVTSLA